MVTCWCLVMSVILHPDMKRDMKPHHHIKRLFLQAPAADASLSCFYTGMPENISTIRFGCVLTTGTALCDVIKASQLPGVEYAGGRKITGSNSSTLPPKKPCPQSHIDAIWHHAGKLNTRLISNPRLEKVQGWSVKTVYSTVTLSHLRSVNRGAWSLSNKQRTAWNLGGKQYF